MIFLLALMENPSYFFAKGGRSLEISIIYFPLTNNRTLKISKIHQYYSLGQMVFFLIDILFHSFVEVGLVCYSIIQLFS